MARAYQIVDCAQFPDLSPGDTHTSPVQLKLYDTVLPPTEWTLMAPDYLGLGLDKLWVHHRMVVNDNGEFGVCEDGKYRRMDFSQYLSKTEFPAFLSRAGQFMILQAPKRVCKDLLRHLGKKGEVRLASVYVQLESLGPDLRDQLGAWFTNVSTEIKAEALFGAGVADTPQYLEASASGTLSSVSITFAAPHCPDAQVTVMLTRLNAVVIYSELPGEAEELALVMAVKSQLLDKALRVGASAPI